MALDRRATSKWYASKVATGVACLLVGIGIGGSTNESPEDSAAYVKLETSHERTKDELASFKQQAESAASESEERSAGLDAKESELKRLEEDLAKREANVKAAEDKAKPQTTTAKPTPGSKPVPLVGGTSSCTRTSSGNCIQGGQFCPKAKYGQTGQDANGRSYRCTGEKSRPHWM